MELYTSRYASKRYAKGDLPEMTFVGISMGRPRFKTVFNVATYLRQLAPPRHMWNLPEQRFTDAYKRRMDKLGFDMVKEMLEKVYGQNGGHPLVLLCFEDVWKGEFCHRRVFADWWEEQTGETVPEI